MDAYQGKSGGSKVFWQLGQRFPEASSKRVEGVVSQFEGGLGTTLPLLALLAFGVRCARRVQPLYLRHEAGECGQLRHEIAKWLRICEFYCLGEIETDQLGEKPQEIVVSHSASESARASASWCLIAAQKIDEGAERVYESVLCVKGSAGAAARGVEENSLEVYRRAFRHDLATLERLGVGQFPTRGTYVDPRESGPLGPIWPEKAPTWYTESVSTMRELLREAEAYEWRRLVDEGDEEQDEKSYEEWREISKRKG